MAIKIESNVKIYIYGPREYAEVQVFLHVLWASILELRRVYCCILGTKSYLMCVRVYVSNDESGKSDWQTGGQDQ